MRLHQTDWFSDTTCANLTSALGRSTAERAARPNGHSFDPFLERVEKDANVQKALRKEGLWRLREVVATVEWGARCLECGYSKCTGDLIHDQASYTPWRSSQHCIITALKKKKTDVPYRLLLLPRIPSLQRFVSHNRGGRDGVLPGKDSACMKQTKDVHCYCISSWGCDGCLDGDNTSAIKEYHLLEGGGKAQNISHQLHWGEWASCLEVNMLSPISDDQEERVWCCTERMEIKDCDDPRHRLYKRQDATLDTKTSKHYTTRSSLRRTKWEAKAKGSRTT